MKIFVRLGCFAVLTFAACNNEPQDDVIAEEELTDSLGIVKADSVLSGENISFFNQSGFSDFAKRKAPAFDWSKFRMVSTWQDDSLMVSEFRQPENYNVYKKLFRYSPDSTKFLDLDSYNVFIEKDLRGNYVADDSGPDTEVSLVDTKTNKKTRLVYMGPGNSVEDGAWIDNDNIVIMGFQQEDNSENRLPVLWRYHIPTHTFFQYEMPDSEVAKQLMGEWRKERLSKINNGK